MASTQTVRPIRWAHSKTMGEFAVDNGASAPSRGGLLRRSPSKVWL
jgi:hypothetical protein